MIRRYSWLLCLSLCALLLSACGEHKSQVDIATSRNTLIWGNGTEPKGLDPHLSTGVSENHIISSLLEGLIAYHPTDDTAIEPGMAERFETNERGDVYTFYLRDAYWSNGDPVTAGDFDYAYRRMLNPELGAEYANMLFVIKNAEAYYNSLAKSQPGKATMPWSEVGVKVIDDKTLQITLKASMPYFPLMLKHYSWYPVNPRTIEEFGGMTDRNGKWTRPENFVCNGPFTLESWKTNEIIIVKKNPNYWDADTVKLDAIHFLPIESADTENRMFRAGQMHLTNTVPLHALDDYRENNPDVLRIDPYLGNYFYRVNVVRDTPLKDPRVRRALAMSVDREALINNVLKAGQIPAYFFVPHGLEDYPNRNYFQYDPEQARNLLAEAGYPDGEGFPELSILFNTSESHKIVAETLQQMWKETLNIDFKPHNQEWKVYLDAQSNLDFDLSRSGWIGDYVDPYTFLEMFTTGNGNNDTGWSNERYDELIREAPNAPSPRTRLTMLAEAESILMKEMPVIPIYIYTRNFLIRPEVKGWNPKLLDNHPVKYISLEAPTQSQ